MKDVLGRMTTNAASRILNSVNSTEIIVEQKAVSIVTKTREDTVSVTREHKLLSGY